MKKQIVEMYNNGLNCVQIGKQIGYSTTTVNTWLREEGIVIRDSGYYKRIHTVNEDYFKVISNEETAYFLGLLYADGNIYVKRKRIQMTFENVDNYLLETMAKRMGSTRKLYIDREKYTKIIIDNQMLMEDLIKLGCIPNKSLILKFPTEEQVPKELVRHFIRGYFDGDGGVSITKNLKKISIGITGTPAFLESIKKILEHEGIYTGPFYKRYKNADNSAGTIFCHERSSVKFYKYLYEEADVSLIMKRKKEKIEYYFKNKVHGKYTRKKDLSKY